VDYVKLRLYVQNLYRILSEKKEWDEADKWYTDLLEVTKQSDLTLLLPSASSFLVFICCVLSSVPRFIPLLEVDIHC
jgi:hypothetical protein